jgi:NAD(P)-dependent dehydrogenase (short-subunit alcohol dehydrogenase family)
MIKTALVIGGTQGIGAATAAKLIESGTTNLVITGRNLELGKQRVEELSRPKVSVTFEPFDVTDLDQINEFTTKYKKNLNGSTIDLVVLCAVRNIHNERADSTMAAVEFPNKVSAIINIKGLELTFAQNVASRWLLTHNLLSSFSQTSVVNVLGAGNGGPINTKDLELESGFSFIAAAGQNASINDVLTVEWSKRIDSSKGNFYHFYPGIVNTKSAANQGFPWIISTAASLALPLIGKSPKAVAEVLLNIPSNNPSGSLIGPSGKKLELLSCLKQDPTLGAQIWDYLEKSCFRNKS